MSMSCMCHGSDQGEAVAQDSEGGASTPSSSVLLSWAVVFPYVVVIEKEGTHSITNIPTDAPNVLSG